MHTFRSGSAVELEIKLIIFCRRVKSAAVFLYMKGEFFMRKIFCAVLFVFLMPVCVYCAESGESGNEKYLRQDVFEARMEALRSDMRLEHGRLDNKIDILRSDSDKKFDAILSELKLLNIKLENLNTKIDNVQQNLEDKITALDNKLESKIAALDNKLESKLAALDNKLDNKIAVVENEIAALDKKFDNKIAVVQSEIAALDTKVDTLQHVIYWALALMGLLVAALALSPIIANSFKSIFVPSITLDQVKDLIRSELANINNARA